MKKSILIALCWLMLSSPCYSEPLNIGTFGDKTYYLQTDSVNFCSTLSCIYISGQEQTYISATILVVPNAPPAAFENNPLSYDKTPYYEAKRILFNRNTRYYLLTKTSTFTKDGNLMEEKDETTDKVTYASGAFSPTPTANAAKDDTGIILRKQIWLYSAPGTSGHKMTQIVIDYANENEDYIMAKSRSLDYIK